METEPRVTGLQETSIAVEGAEGVSGGAVDVEIVDDGDATCVQTTECSLVEWVYREGVEHGPQHTALTYTGLGEEGYEVVVRPIKERRGLAVEPKHKREEG